MITFGMLHLEDGSRSALLSLKFHGGSWLGSVTTLGKASTSLDRSQGIRKSKEA